MASSRYWELTVEVPEEASEGVTNFVWELGALGVVEEEAPGRPPRLRAFFPKTTFARALEESVREYLAGLRELGFPGAGEPSVVALANEDWAEAWRAHFRPLPVGKRLLIAPPWDRPPANGRVVIAIEPGRAARRGQPPDHGAPQAGAALRPLRRSRRRARARRRPGRGGGRRRGRGRRPRLRSARLDLGGGLDHPRARPCAASRSRLTGSTTAASRSTETNHVTSRACCVSRRATR